ncbi:unnamed protein product [Gulo gulo]|uniref:Uncharacterized protein n=1 Tax=Gulo gulo TaxID=48420 RepID=A0A9X9LLG7_GULGU|nr:unnamed protein product [Gulo gulo]
MTLSKDLLLLSLEERKRKHEKECLLQSPSSFFTDMSWPGCYKIRRPQPRTSSRSVCWLLRVLCQPTGGNTRLLEGCTFRRKHHPKHLESKPMGNYPNKHIVDLKKEEAANQMKQGGGKEYLFHVHAEELTRRS